MVDAGLIGAAVILTAGVTLQTAVGFGLGLLCIPMLVWVGYPLPEAVAFLIGAGCVQTGLGTYALRDQVRWRFVLPLIGFSAVGIGLGQVAMGLVVGAGQAFVKQLVGVMLLVVLIARTVYRPVPREQLAPGWGYLAAGLGGVLSGAVGMGGPPLVLFALAHTWNKDQYRAFIWPIFFLTTPMVVGCIGVQFGSASLWQFGLGLALAPCAWLGSRMGMALSRKWEMHQLQRGATALLYGIALSSILAPLLFG